MNDLSQKYFSKNPTWNIMTHCRLDSSLHAQREVKKFKESRFEVSLRKHLIVMIELDSIYFTVVLLRDFERESKRMYI